MGLECLKQARSDTIALNVSTLLESLTKWRLAVPCLEMRVRGILLVALWLCAALSFSPAAGQESATNPKQPAALSIGEAGRLRGRVVRASTREMAVHADVRLIKQPLGSFSLPLVPNRVRSSENGEFTFDGLDPGTYLVYAFLGDESSRKKQFDFEKVVINEQRQQTKPVELQLTRGVTLRLRVISQGTGKPLPTAKLGFRWTDGDDDFRANDQGEIVVPALTAQLWHLEVTAPGHACDIRDVKLVGTETVINVSLAAGGEISGRVVDEKGESLPGAKVGVQVEHQAMYNLDQTITSGKGAYRLQYLPIGRPLRLGISHPGFNPFDVKFSVASPAPVDRGDVQLTPLAHGGTITGKVVDIAGKPIAGVTIENYGSSSINQNTTHSDADGRFTIPRLYVYVANRVLLIVRAKGFTPRQIDLTDNDRDGAERLQIVLEPGHRIRGRVVNHAGQPIAGCRVSFAEGHHANPIGGRFDADSEGRFKFDSLPPNCPFSFFANGYSPLEVQTLPLDQNDEVIVRLEPIGTIRGQVIDAVTRKPVSEFNVRIAFPSQHQPVDKRSHGITSTRMNPGEDFIAANGQFELKDFVNGDLWDVIVRAKNYRTKRLVSVQAAPESDAKLIAVKLQPGGTSESIKVAGMIMGPEGNPASGVQVRFIGLDEQAGASRKESLFMPSADDTHSSTDPSDDYDEFRTAVTDAKGEFTFGSVPRALSAKLVYWSDTVPLTRVDHLEAKTSEDLSQLQLTHEKPVIVRATIDRKAFPDATELWLHGRDSKNFRDRRLGLIEGQSRIEVQGLEAGTFSIVLLGKPEFDDDFSGGSRTKSIGMKTVTASVGETIKVTFDDNAQR